MQPTASPFRVSCRKVASFCPRSFFSLSCHTWAEIRTGFGTEIRRASGELFPTRQPLISTTLWRSREGPLARSDEPEQECCHLAHLNLFAALRDAVAPMVPVDVFERLVTRVTDPAVHLHRPISGFAAQPVRPVVAH